jgi:hypothetical protein
VWGPHVEGGFETRERQQATQGRPDARQSETHSSLRRGGLGGHQGREAGSIAEGHRGHVKHKAIGLPVNTVTGPGDQQGAREQVQLPENRQHLRAALTDTP